MSKSGLTIYSVVKGFDGHIGTIQRNAIRSWRAVCPHAQILLFGEDEPGAMREAEQLDERVYPLPRNKYRAPLVPAVIESAHKLAQNDVFLLVNADIILPPQFEQAWRAVANGFDEFLLCAPRSEVKLEREIDFSDKDWYSKFRELPHKGYGQYTLDLFVYRGNWLFKEKMPPFGQGRKWWDTWVARQADRHDVPFVDGAWFFSAWHQEHWKEKPREQVKLNRAYLNDTGGVGGGGLLSCTWRLNKRCQLILTRRGRMKRFAVEE